MRCGGVLHNALALYVHSLCCIRVGDSSMPYYWVPISANAITAECHAAFACWRTILQPLVPIYLPATSHHVANQHCVQPIVPCPATC